MCGIAGALATRMEDAPPVGAAERFAAALVHRGPDGHGFFHAGPVASPIGASRSSISRTRAGSP